jgi:hypothetical protein
LGASSVANDFTRPPPIEEFGNLLGVAFLPQRFDEFLLYRHLRQGCRAASAPETDTATHRASRPALYANGYSLAAIGNQVGLTPTAVGNALKRAGVTLRDTLAAAPHAKI